MTLEVRRAGVRRFSLNVILPVFAVIVLSPATYGQTQDQTVASSTETAKTQPTTTPVKATNAVLSEFKGVAIGDAIDDARHKLGKATEKSDTQDVYDFSDKQSAQVFYDSQKKVFAISLSYEKSGNAPTPEVVFGHSVDPKPDGSIYWRQSYPESGYWLAYSRTAGNSPIVTITIQKIP